MPMTPQAFKLVYDAAIGLTVSPALLLAFRAAWAARRRSRKRRFAA